jgi:hemerythrin-like metal-binding protein
MEAHHATVPLTGNRSLDEEHQRLFDDLARTAALEGESFAAACSAIIAGIEHDFRHEEDLMEGIDYPALGPHREQHARVLGGLHHAEAALLRGDAAPARRCMELLPQWLELHIATQDAPLALLLEPASAA